MEITKSPVHEKTGSLTESITTPDQAKNAIFGLYRRLDSVAIPLQFEMGKPMTQQHLEEIAQQNPVMRIGHGITLFQNGHPKYNLELLKEVDKNDDEFVILTTIDDDDKPSQAYMVKSDATILRLNAEAIANESEGADFEEVATVADIKGDIINMLELIDAHKKNGILPEAA